MNKEFLEYDEAKKVIHKLKIPSKNAFFELVKEGSLPKGVPKDPSDFYKKRNTWIRWGDFLGTGTIATQQLITLSYDEAKKVIHKLKIPSKNAFFKLAKLNKLPKGISKEPRGTYTKQKTWISWGDFLGTGTIATQTVFDNYLSFTEARKKARELAREFNLNTFEDWKKAKKEGKIPRNIPSEPNRIYSKKRKK